jgi:hypothetical protein
MNEWSASRLGHFTRGKEPQYPLDRRLDRPCEEGKNLLPLSCTKPRFLGRPHCSPRKIGVHSEQWQRLLSVRQHPDVQTSTGTHPVSFLGGKAAGGLKQTTRLYDLPVCPHVIVFWVMTSCSLVGSTNVSEEHIAFIVRAEVRYWR